jgi:hypothetical protein
MVRSSWAVVVPSNRQVVAYRLAAIPSDVQVYIVEDSDSPVPVDRENVRVFSKAFQKQYMGGDYDLIPRRSAACRNFAFYYIWRETEHEYIVSLDDDVVTRPGFLESYSILGQRHTLPTVSGTDWLNPIDLFCDAPPCYARGFPYEARGAAPPTWSTTDARIVAHMGLWDGVLDTHALDKQLFAEYRQIYPDLKLVHEVVRPAAVPCRVKFPLSSMNFGFIRESLPALYQIPMRSVFLDRYALWRYDDIWAGYLAQTLIAIRNDAFTAGAPIVEHEKAGGTLAELQGEHYGILLSPYLYAVVDRAAADVRPASYQQMYGALMEGVLSHEASWRKELTVPDHYAAFIVAIASTLMRWAELCDRGAGA